MLPHSILCACLQMCLPPVVDRPAERSRFGSFFLRQACRMAVTTCRYDETVRPALCARLNVIIVVRLRCHLYAATAQYARGASTQASRHTCAASECCAC